MTSMMEDVLVLEDLFILGVDLDTKLHIRKIEASSCINDCSFQFKRSV